MLTVIISHSFIYFEIQLFPDRHLIFHLGKKCEKINFVWCTQIYNNEGLYTHIYINFVARIKSLILKMFKNLLLSVIIAEVSETAV